MNTELFQVELLGGPEDGYCAGVNFVPRTTMRLPSTSASSLGYTSVRRSAVADQAAHYDLACVQVGRDSNGLPLVRLRYEFIGTETVRPASRLNRLIRGVLRSLGLSRFGSAMPTLRQKFAAWMMEPIDYPLKNIATSSTTTSRTRFNKLS